MAGKADPPSAAPAVAPDFEAGNLGPMPIRDLHLSLEDSPLAPVVTELERELAAHGIRRLRPRFYLSTEWGVPFGSTAIAIPFYQARPELTRLHADRTGFVEGLGRAELLRYLRHEMGHVFNYAYRLYESAEWVRLFGPITRPYVEECRPQPFSRRFVRHLPGWYAQKHPDEDWAETFAVWLTPGLDWRAEYAGWPEALAKLEHCDRTVAELGDREPLPTTSELDAEVSEIATPLEQFYRDLEQIPGELPPDLESALCSLFADLMADEPRNPPAAAGGDGGTAADRAGPPCHPAAELIRGLARDLPAEVYRWTGHFPERTRGLLHQLAARAEALRLAYPASREREALLAVTTLITALAMNHVHAGSYAP